MNENSKTFEQVATEVWTGLMQLFWGLIRVLRELYAQLSRRSGPPASRPSASRGDPFDLNFPLLMLTPQDAFTIGHAVEGVHITGANGGGKSSGPGQALIKAYMLAKMGMLILTAKPGEYETIRRYAEETGCLKRLIRFAPEEPWRFNFLAYLQKLPSRGAGLAANIVATLITMQEAMDKGNKGGHREQYWLDTLKELLMSAVDLCLLARPQENLSVERLHDVISSAPTSAAQVDDEVWQATSLDYQLVEEALNREALTDRQRSDLKITGKYWLSQFPQLASETRSSIVSTFTSMADGFLRGSIADLFGTGLNVTPEFTLDGYIIVVDLPVKLFGPVGVAAQTLWKFCWQDAVERRDVSKNPRPVALIADEAHLFVNEHDVSFATTARSSKACMLYLTQTLANYTHALGGEQKAKALTASLLDVLQTKFFCANASHETNTWASDIIGKVWTHKQNAGVNRGDTGTRSTNSGSTESLEYAVDPAVFQTLRRGGESSGYIVEAVCHGGGKVFKASGKNYVLTAFDQKA